MARNTKTPSLAQRYRIDRPERFRLADIAPDATGEMEKAAAAAAFEGLTTRLVDLQERLYAEDSWAVLVIFQGVDAAGKDSAIKHVMGGLNPQGCTVYPFKAPTADELDHDFLWRAVLRLPRRGDIAIFNRSYYEEVLVVRVHQELLSNQRLPPPCRTPDIWKKRFEDINAFERHLVRSGTLVLKFHLRISREEQKRRFIERLDDPTKRWKFAMQDVAERKLWDDYMAAYEDAIRHTSTPEAPWYVVPSDHKWFARLVIAGALVEALEGLDLKYPKFDESRLTEMKRVRKALEAD